jgi:hypothetical protein
MLMVRKMMEFAAIYAWFKLQWCHMTSKKVLSDLNKKCHLYKLIITFKSGCNKTFLMGSPKRVLIMS